MNESSLCSNFRVEFREDLSYLTDPQTAATVCMWYLRLIHIWIFIVRCTYENEQTSYNIRNKTNLFIHEKFIISFFIISRVSALSHIISMANKYLTRYCKTLSIHTSRRERGGSQRWSLTECCSLDFLPFLLSCVSSQPVQLGEKYVLQCFISAQTKSCKKMKS